MTLCRVTGLPNMILDFSPKSSRFAQSVAWKKKIICVNFYAVCPLTERNSTPVAVGCLSCNKCKESVLLECIILKCKNWNLLTKLCVGCSKGMTVKLEKNPLQFAISSIHIGGSLSLSLPSLFLDLSISLSLTLSLAHCISVPFLLSLPCSFTLSLSLSLNGPILIPGLKRCCNKVCTSI